ncbi:MAG: hypothetical protein ABI373_03760 [Flavobacteriales bacterium]
MRKDSAEAVDMITRAAAPAHVVSRLLATSEERVRNVFLDPALRAIWAISGMLTTSVPPVILDQVDVLLKEHVQGHVIDVRIRLLERMRGCEVHVELRMDPALDRSTLFGLGIDDLWETRLYAIADLLALCTPRKAELPLARLDQQLRTLEVQ